jgi:BCD family chlorophyll transporter-like MFS transporter
MGNIPQAGRFMAVLCLFTFSMFLNDAVLEPYGAAVFGMSVCATTALNASLALGFFVGMLFSGFQLIHRIGNIRASQWGAGLAVVSLALLLLAAPIQSLGLLRLGVTLFGLSLGVCMNACLTLMFNFLQPGQTGFLLGVWGAGYAYSCGLATISGGGLLTLFQWLNGGDPFGAYVGLFAFQIVCFVIAAAMTQRLDVTAFRDRVQSSFGERMQAAVD